MDSCTRLKLQTCLKKENEIRYIQYSRLCGLVVRTADSYTCGRWFDIYLTYILSSFCLFVFEALRPRQQIFSNVGTISSFHRLNH